MQIRKSENAYLIYVEKDERIMETLTRVCKEQGILNGQLAGIGAVKDMELGAYDLDSQSYTRKLIPGPSELISFQGNIVLKDAEPFIHAHVTIGDHDFNISGGHLFEGTVAVVGEFILRPIDSDAHRELNPDIGLPTWCLD